MGTVERFARIPKHAPVDRITPEHHWIDDRLCQWGRWARARIGTNRCGSIEGEYRSPWRQWYYPSYEELMPALAEPEIRLIDRAVQRVSAGHQLALKMHYVVMANPSHICRKVKIHASVFGAWMHDARSMVLNNMRLLERTT